MLGKTEGRRRRGRQRKRWLDGITDSMDLFSSVQSLSRVWLCDPMDCSTPGFPVHQQLLELVQTHVRRVWANSRRWWSSGKPGSLQSTGSQRVWHDLELSNNKHKPGATSMSITELALLRALEKSLFCALLSASAAVGSPGRPWLAVASPHFLCCPSLLCASLSSRLMRTPVLSDDSL